MPVTCTVAEDGTFTGWRAELDDLVAAVREQGTTPEPALTDLHATIEVALSPAEPQQVGAPAADQVVEWDEATEPIQVAFGHCGRVQVCHTPAMGFRPPRPRPAGSGRWARPGWRSTGWRRS